MCSNKVVGPTTIKFERKTPDLVRPDSLKVTYVIDGESKTVRFKNKANELPEIE